jgi:predicted metal-dependent phosphotriesterase family hydrolase
MNPLSRRTFLRTALTTTAAFGVLPWQAIAADDFTGKVMTVLGPIEPSELGRTLAHEHGVVDFIGAEKAPRLRHDSQEAFATILPHLEKLKQLGCRSLVECTPNFIGRDVALLKRLATASGLHILTNTGYYGAASNKFLPRHAYTEGADELAVRWLREWRDGIGNTGVRPGFLKLGVEKGKLSELHVKLVSAGARAHLKSGLAIAIHTGDGEAALDELRVLKEEGVAPNALIWVHAQNDGGAIQLEAARRGAWVSLDGFSAKRLDRYVEWLAAFRKEGLLKRVLLSHDHFWSVEGSDTVSLKLHSGGEAPFQSVWTSLVPGLRENGFTQEEIDQVTIKNVAEAFTVRRRGL